jgi:PAS domain S-box-containing protein
MGPGSVAPGLPPEFYVLLFQQVAEGVFVADPQGRLIAVNPRVCDILGFAEEEILGRPFQDFLDPEDLRKNPARLADLRAGKHVVSERRLRCKDGRLLPVEITTRMMPDGHLLGIVRDLTERMQVEHSLRDAHWRLESIIEGTHVGTWEWNVQTGEVVLSERWAQIVGCTLEELGAVSIRTWESLVHPEDRKESDERLRRHFAGELPYYDCDCRMKHRDGHWVWVHDRGRVISRTNDGKPLMMFGTHADITERRQALEALKASETLLHATMDAVADGVLVVDERGAVVHRNARFAELWRIPKDVVERGDDDRLLGFVLDQLEDPEAFLAKVRALYGSVEESSDLLRFKDGRVFERHSCPLMHGDVIGGRVWSFRDVTERAQTETALRESEGRYRTLFEGASDAIFLMEGGRFVDCNARTLEIFGCARNEILSCHPADFSPPEQRDGSASGPRAEAWIGAALAGEPQSFEWLHCRRDGTPFDAEVSLARLEWQGRVFLQAIVRDVTERKTAERGRLEMERRLFDAQKLESLGVLAGGIAHDFNNLLMAILGNLELALRDLSPVSPAQPRIEAASSAARRAANLTRQMLAYSGRGRFMVGRLDLNELVEENVHLLRTSIPRTTTLDLHLDRALPAVEADAGQIQQVIMNLVTNAAEAIGDQPGTITLSTGARDCDAASLGRSRLDGTLPAGRYACFEVTDSGCGMDEQTQKRMFEPFFTTKFTGRGLGMAAVLGIVRGHRGAILVESAVGKGATIRVLLPEAGAAPGAAAPAVDARGGRAGAAAPEVTKGTILIVDDEDMVLQPCTAMVQSMGFAVLTAVDGERAVEVVRRNGAGIRAIILDLTMPNLDGAAALERILSIEPDAKVILSSGYDEEEATRRVAKERLAGFIRKPFGLEQLRCALERALGPAL